MTLIIHDDIRLFRTRIERAENIAIFAHVRPDGDSIGAVFALGWMLSDMGKKIQYISDDPVPERYHFLFQYTEDGKDPFIPEPADADCFILPDISSVDRAGKFFDIHPDIKPDICIDHHVSNPGFASWNWIESDSPAACCVITELFTLIDVPMTKRISTALLCGIITDTNSFSTSNVTADSLRYSAELIDKGAQIFDICHEAYKVHSMGEMALWKLGMDNIHIEGSLIWSVFRKADRDRIGYIGDDDAGFVSYMGNTQNINVSILFTEVTPNEVKISWRSLPGFDVARVAVACGGGGHAAASGATIRKPLDDVIPQVLKISKNMLFYHDGKCEDQ